MPNSTEKILQELEAERLRRQNLTKEDLQKKYADLQRTGFPLSECIGFIADLGGSNQLAYHYELICKDWERDDPLHLDNSFDKHDLAGIDFLFAAINKASTEKIRVFTAYLIAEILVRSKHRDFHTAACNRLVPILVSLTNTKDCVLRRKVLIAVGWVGTAQEIGIFNDRMLHDEDSLCRAWSASGLWQLSCNRLHSQTILPEVKDVFRQAIAAEKDLFACGVMIESAQSLFGKKWISAIAVENEDVVKIEKARKSAVRFLSKD